MAGKLKIIRVLSNPIRKRKKSAKPKRRKGARQRKTRSLSGKWILRRAAPGGVMWWTGSRWGSSRGAAHRYASQQAAARALTAARRKAGVGWTVLDVMPA
jgi:hypothetical protein